MVGQALDASDIGHRQDAAPSGVRTGTGGGGARAVTRSRLLRGALAGAGALTLGAACRLPRGAESGRPDSANFPAELTWMPWSADNQWLTPAYEQVAADFSKHYPKSKLVIQPAGGDFPTKFKTLVAAGTPPDVADVHHGGRVRDVGPSGQVLDLTPFLKRDPYPKSHVGWEPYRWLNKQYGVPWALQSTAIFYNKALFDAAGVQYPTDRWTWDDFADAARRLTKPGADAASTIWGAGDQGGRNYQWMNALFASFGGGILKPDYSTCILPEPANVAGMEFRASWGSKLRISPNQPGGTSGQFTNGNFAMVTSGSWFVANVKQNALSRLVTSGVPWDVAPVPRGRSRRAALAHELGAGIPSNVPHREASWAAVRYITSIEALVPFARIGRIIPPDRTRWSDAIPPDGQPASFKRAFLDGWDEINIEPPFVPRWPEVEAMWQEELDKVWTGERPARDGAVAFKNRMDEHLRLLKREGLL